MRANLIYNPNSGGAGQVTPEELVEMLTHAGFHPIHHSTSSELELDQQMSGMEGLVVVAGGDGSVRAVVTRLIGKKLPVALIPLGTANNIAHSLDIQGTPQDIITGLRNPLSRPFDVGLVRSTWGEDYFLESFGLGLFAEGLQEYQPEKGKSLIRSIAAVIQTFKTYRTYPCRMVLDGKNISGQFLMVEVLNTRAFGPRIKLSPGADPGDGLLDVVQITANRKEGFLNYLASILTERVEELSDFECSQGKVLKIACPNDLLPIPFHVDAEVRPKKVNPSPQDNPAPGVRPKVHDPGKESALITVEILPGAVEFWIPQAVD